MSRHRLRFLLRLLLALPGPALPALSADEWRVTLAGQALIKHDLRTAIPEELPALRRLFAPPADVVFTNLETAIAGPFGGEPTRRTQFFHATSPAVLDCLHELGFNLLATGNNHAWDLGEAGILSTLLEVRRRGFAHAGTGRNLGEAAAPAFLDTPRGRVALVACASGRIAEGAAATADRAGVNEVRLGTGGDLLPEDVDRVLAAVAQARRFANLVIVYQHDHYWEEDRRETPAWKQRFARRCIEAGADLFVSHGVPQLHGAEIYRGRAIFYGLGSFVFHTITAVGHYQPEVWQSVLVDLTYRGRELAGVTVRPLVLNERGSDPARELATRGFPRAARGEEAARVLGEFTRLSARHGTVVRTNGDTATIELPATPAGGRP